EITDEDLAAQFAWDREGKRRCAEHRAQALLDNKGEAEGEQQAQGRVEPVEVAKQEPLDRDADDADDDRRDDEYAGEAERRREHDREVRADGVEAAMREIDNASER